MRLHAECSKRCGPLLPRTVSQCGVRNAMQIVYPTCRRMSADLAQAGNDRWLQRATRRIAREAHGIKTPAEHHCFFAGSSSLLARARAGFGGAGVMGAER